MKKYLLVVLSILLVLFCGCEETPGATAVNSPGAAAAEEETYQRLEEDTDLAPYLIGTQKQLQEANGSTLVVYVAEADNPYGLTPGAYVGEYKSNVFIDGAQTGGIALVGTAAEYLVNEALNQIPYGQPKVKIALPMDIAMSDGSAVSIEVAGQEMVVSCDIALTILWNVPDSDLVYVGGTAYNGIDGDLIYDIRNIQFDSGDAPWLSLSNGEKYVLESNAFSYETAMSFIQLFIEQGAYVSTFGKSTQGFAYARRGEGADDLFGYSPYNDKARTGKIIHIACHESFGQNGLTLSASDILTVGNVPVFLTTGADR